jgi:hypothetical protein
VVSNKQKLEQRDPFSLLERDGSVRIMISNETLRRFIWDQIDEQSLITNSHLYSDTDTDDIKLSRDRNSSFPIESAIQQWVKWFDTSKNIMDDLYERYEKICDNITDLGRVLQEERLKLTQDSDEVLNGKEVGFSKLYFILSQKDLILCVEHDHALVAGEVVRVDFRPASFFGPASINLQIKIYTHSGKCLTVSRHNHTIYGYAGEVSLNELGIVILTDEVKQMLIERGKKYVQVSSNPNYVAHTGVITRRSWWSNTTFRSTGRVMVDLQAMKSIDSNYSSYFAIDRDRDVSKDMNTEITDIMYMSTSPYVYGFSFTAKVWGEMLVDHLSDIVFREDAYDMLVLPSDIKDMLSSLVDSNELVGKDFIDGKGGGCIFLLAGSPGVGKTLTAEAIAEKLQKPLYMVGIGELGTNVEDLESNLRDILDIAASWEAVLLLDEADIFMEARNDADIERNAMVGVFLRLLEYYQGTLFLTTNRAKSIDPAFYSRISLAIKYEDLDEDSRQIIWSNILKLYELDTLVDISQLAKYDINGRQIKNVTRIVTSLARTNNLDPTTDDFIRVINHVTKFNNTL